MTDFAQYLAANQVRFEQSLLELLRIPSVSADSRRHADVERAADWVLRSLRELGLEAELIPTAGKPMVFAQSPPVSGAPVALVYGHYDVQPPDPLEEWLTPPFEPTIRDGNVYARGATDDKGQVLTHVFGVEAWLKSGRTLPLQVKFLIEGEEEVGSKGLTDYLPQAAEKLACDVVVISDTSQFALDRPAITYGLKGIGYFELRVQGPRQDLHSGVFGGCIANPINVLARVLSQLIDQRGRVQIPGFYDQVKPPTDQERAQFADLDFDEDAFFQQIGVSQGVGEEGFTTLERRWVRPTYDINGIWGGYQEEGSKTVLPARAAAKFSFRLVPEQDPAEIARLLRAHLETLMPPGVTWELIDMHGGRPFLTPLESPYLHAAKAAISAGFGVPPVMIREGGSIPIVNQFVEQLQAAVLLLGWGLNDDNAHGPNEKFRLLDFHRGIASRRSFGRSWPRSPWPDRERVGRRWSSRPADQHLPRNNTQSITKQHAGLSYVAEKRRPGSAPLNEDERSTPAPRAWELAASVGLLANIASPFQHRQTRHARS